MAKTTIWMPWYISDYLKDTITLTLEEDCLYRRALDFLWQNPIGIPIETHRLCSALRVDKPKLEELNWVLEHYLQKEGNYYRSKRIDEEYAKALHNNKIQKENGKLGGRPKNPRDNPRVMPRDNPRAKPNETPSPSPSEEKEKDPPSPPRGVSVPPQKFVPEYEWFIHPRVTEAWQGFLEMRRGLKAEMKTPRARLLTLGRLHRMGEGDPERIAELLDQSTMNGWKGIFPLGHQGAKTAAMRTLPPDPEVEAAAEIRRRNTEEDRKHARENVDAETRARNLEALRAAIPA